MEEVTRKKNEFLESVGRMLIESDVRSKDAAAMINKLNIQAGKNLKELSALLSWLAWKWNIYIH